MPPKTVQRRLGALLAEIADLTADLHPLAVELDMLADRAAKLEVELRSAAAEEAKR